MNQIINHDQIYNEEIKAFETHLSFAYLPSLLDMPQSQKSDFSYSSSNT